jgi:hypothetical protein
MSFKSTASIMVGVASLWFAASATAQQVCLPAPRLLTTIPMGGQVGTSFDVTITGQNLDDFGDLLFSNPKISAKPKLGADGKPEANKFTVTIAADAPRGVHEARIMSRLGISSSRAFSVGTLAEVTRVKPNNSLETALELKPNSVCNAVMTQRAVDFYTFQGGKDKRVVVDCATAGIDSKLAAVLIIADSAGRDLLVDRAGGFLDFTPPADGKYLIKVHSLTFKGGPEHFYRLALLDAPAKGPVAEQPSTLAVSAFSWTPDEKSTIPKSAEAEPNNLPAQVQKITLPCEIAGAFYPAADVDSFEFAAKKGEVWWVEVVSERLGLPTDPFVLVQHVTSAGGKEKLTDVAELNDIPSPMKPSSNGYSYDGPPYDAGSPDVLGKMEIKEDGQYRLQLRDLFGGTRSDPRNVYRLIVRKAEPDFSLVAWAFHMNLRNGDRNALSKPIALRGGSTMAFEVVTVRKDGFEGEIELGMTDLPAGVTASGLKIPAGKSKGMMLITAAENAPRSIAGAKLFGKAEINGASVSRPCRLASMAWPVRDATNDIPRPRLMEDAPVSVNGTENAPITIAPKENKVFAAKAGEKLTIPLKIAWRSEFTGTSIKLKAFGAGFEGVKEFDVPLKATNSEAVLDLATLKTLPGEYTLAFYGSAVTKYRYNPDAIKSAAEEEKLAEQKVQTVAAMAKKLADEAKAAAAAKKAEAEAAAKLAVEQLKTADAAKAGAAKRMKAVTTAATPTDTVDIFVSEPIRILVTAADKK